MSRITSISERLNTLSNIVNDTYPPLKGIRAQTGTESNPTISFANDTDTGLFSPMANTLGMVTGGKAQLVVDHTGNTRIEGNLIPSQNAVQSIGTSNMHFKEAWIDTLHVSSNTLYLGNTPVLGTDQDSIAIRADSNQHISIQTTGLGVTSLFSSNGATIAASGLNSEVNMHANGSGGSVQISANTEITMNTPSVTVSSNLTVMGNLVLNGEQLTANVQAMETQDNIILVNSGQVGAGVTSGYAGFRVDRGNATDHQLVFDETTDKFVIGPVGGETTIASETYVNAQTYNTSNIVSGVLGVTRGGTGTTTVTGSNGFVMNSNATIVGSTVINPVFLGGTMSDPNIANGWSWSNADSIMIGSNGSLQVQSILSSSLQAFNSTRSGFGVLCVSSGPEYVSFINSNDAIMDTAMGPQARNSLRIRAGKWSDCNYSTSYGVNGITMDAGGSTHPNQAIASNAGLPLCLNTARKGLVWVGSNMTVDSRMSCTHDVYAKGVKLTSDDRVKENETILTNATETINKLRPQIYDKKSAITCIDTCNTTEYVKESGLIAQEVFYDAPELRHLVTLPDDANSNALYTSTIQSSTDPSIDPSYTDWGEKAASLNYIGLIPYLVKSLQETHDEINTIVSRVEAMEQTT